MFGKINFPLEVSCKILGGLCDPGENFLDLQSLISAFCASKLWAKIMREITDADCPGFTDALCREVRRLGLGVDEKARVRQDANEWACKRAWITSFTNHWPVSQIAIRHAINIVKTYRDYSLRNQIDLLVYAGGGRGFPNGAQLLEDIKVKYLVEARALHCLSLCDVAKNAALSNAVKMLILSAIEAPPVDNGDTFNAERPAFLKGYFEMVAGSEPLLLLAKGMMVDGPTFDQAKKTLWQDVWNRESFWGLGRPPRVPVEPTPSTPEEEAKFAALVAHVQQMMGIQVPVEQAVQQQHSEEGSK